MLSNSRKNQRAGNCYYSVAQKAIGGNFEILPPNIDVITGAAVAVGIKSI